MYVKYTMVNRDQMVFVQCFFFEKLDYKEVDLTRNKQDQIENVIFFYNFFSGW